MRIQSFAQGIICRGEDTKAEQEPEGILLSALLVLKKNANY